HRRAVEEKGASDYEADITVARTFEKIVEQILAYDPQRGANPRGWIRRISDRTLADIRGELGGAGFEPVDDEHRQLVDPNPVTAEDLREISVRKANEEWTLKRGYQYLRCTVTTVEGLDEGDRNELREGPHDHPGRQRKPLREAAEHYRASFRACFGSP